MRALLVLLVAVAGGCDRDVPPTTAPAPAVSAPAVRPRSATPVANGAQRPLDECRDACEQQAIVEQSGPAILRVCRARCDARFAAAAPPHEVPSRITRAAPVHAPPAVRPRQVR